MQCSSATPFPVRRVVVALVAALAVAVPAAFAVAPVAAPVAAGVASAVAPVAADDVPSGPAGAGAPVVRAVAAVGMTVGDLDASIDFYARVLGFRLVSEVEVAGDAVERLQGLFGVRMRVARLRLGEEILELTEYLAPRGRPIPLDARSSDHDFQHVAIVTRDMRRAYRRLRAHRVAHVSTGPQRLPDWNPSAGGIEAFYFRDPDGHVLEAIRFPAGKGRPRWQCTTCGLFLGIDHTAMVVADTERSLAFYRDRLGLAVAGTSENWGPEQAHLNHVPGAHLRITSLRAAAGPGIELLEYLAPRDGRPAPADRAANDLAHWQTDLATGDPAAAVRRLATGGATFVSPETVAFPDAALGFRAGTMLRDPDGHALRVLAP